MNRLFYGDNLDILRNKVRDETVDLCYIDPPFNSKRNYNQIYNNVGSEDLAQEQAFVDTWTWDDQAREGYPEVIANATGRYSTQTIELIKGLRNVLGEGSLLAYLVSMTRRVVEIHRVLKTTGSFYLHCDPTASHYLKIVLDTVFCPRGGNFINEIVWCYELGGRISKRAYGRRHDVLLFYVKSDDYKFNWDQVLEEWSVEGIAKFRHEDEKGRYRLIGRFLKGSPIKGHRDVSPEWEKTHPDLVQRYYLKAGKMQVDYWNISPINQVAKERLGYPTQKPESLLERVIKASSPEGGTVLDAYCGCGTTVAVAQRLNRNWIGMDITYQSIALVLKRLEDTFGKDVADAIILDGVPQDMASAQALAHKRDDRVRKEFEKWAVLTYTMNRAAINYKKGADAGIDGTAYFWKTKDDTDKAVFQVKSGGVGRGDIAKLKGDMEREKAAIGTLITLEDPTRPMRLEAKQAGMYADAFTGRNCDRVQIVTIQDILEQQKRFAMPLTAEVLKAAQAIEEEGTQSAFTLMPDGHVEKKRKMVKASLPLGFKQPITRKSSKRGR